jgi:hypothetical protein
MKIILHGISIVSVIAQVRVPAALPGSEDRALKQELLPSFFGDLILTAHFLAQQCQLMVACGPTGEQYGS